jgi:hypothetical protein
LNIWLLLGAAQVDMVILAEVERVDYLPDRQT